MKAVLFDLYDTLVTEAGKKMTRASSVGPLLGCDDWEFRCQWKRARSRIMRGALSFEEGLTRISLKLAGSADREAIRSICECRREEKSAVFADVDDDVAHMTDALYKRGYRLAVVSNRFAEDVAAWSTWKLSKSFMSTAFSFEIGAAKPDAEIYTEASGIQKLSREWLYERTPYNHSGTPAGARGRQTALSLEATGSS